MSELQQELHVKRKQRPVSVNQHDIFDLWWILSVNCDEANRKQMAPEEKTVSSSVQLYRCLTWSLHRRL
ncbi:hypothetical protein, partial [Enterococcus faecalis]|uniref:hypothetical protein n=1 Tax=Enterococcus faecalis TaxID=1351 RepID=UPI003D6A133E